MSAHTGLVELERSAWEALASSGEDAAAFYERVLADRVLMLLPGGLVIDDRAQVVDSMRGAPWDEFELSDERVVPVGDDGAVVAYRARARRGDSTYEALFSSTYVREGGAWRLALHQQTPI
ncbi:MAG TPA: nuclear transport factor 2 family protein [Acidimicrobiales bacterium]